MQTKADICLVSELLRSYNCLFYSIEDEHICIHEWIKRMSMINTKTEYIYIYIVQVLHNSMVDDDDDAFSIQLLLLSERKIVYLCTAIITPSFLSNTFSMLF